MDQNLEQKYSRQLGSILSINDVKTLASYKVAIFGLSGLGAEVCKNLVLLGIQSFVLVDNEILQIHDLNVNCFARDEYVGKLNRSQACHKGLVELNKEVIVSIEEQFSVDIVQNVDICILTKIIELDQLILLNNECRNLNKKFIFALSKGLDSILFEDFSDQFTIQNPNSFFPSKGVIINIQRSNPCVIQYQQESKSFEKQDIVRFLDDYEAQILKVSEHEQFTEIVLDFDGTKIPENKINNNNNLIAQIIQPLNLENQSFASFIQDNEILPEEKVKFVGIINQKSHYFGFLSLLQFNQKYKHLPAYGVKSDYELFKEIFQEKILNSKDMFEEEDFFDEQELQLFCYTSTIENIAMVSFWGAIVAQEVVVSTGRFMPIDQFLFFKDYSILPNSNNLINQSIISLNDRYYHTKQLFGEDFQQRLQNLQIFLVGCGALGCEQAKILALSGVGSGTNGQIVATDNDRIEISNLSRQFLFQEQDIYQSKSEVLTKKVKQMNNNLQITSYQEFANYESEKYLFNSKFYRSIDFIICAVDNFEARVYLDTKAFQCDKIFIESGTFANSSNNSVVIPNQTIQYQDLYASAIQNHNTKERFEFCTIKQIPFKSSDNIGWGFNFFLNEFTNQRCKNENKIISDLQWNQIIQNAQNELLIQEMCKSLFNLLFNQIIRNMQARDQSQQLKQINNQQQLEGQFDNLNLLQNNENTTQIQRHFKYQIYDEKDVEHVQFVQFLQNVIKLVINQSINGQNKQESIHFFEKFDKDDEQHMDLVAATVNLRCRVFNLIPIDKSDIRLIVGDIIPSIITATSLISGAVFLEFFKIVANLDKIQEKSYDLNNLRSYSFQLSFQSYDYTGLELLHEDDKIIIKNYNQNQTIQNVLDDFNLTTIYKIVITSLQNNPVLYLFNPKLSQSQNLSYKKYLNFNFELIIKQYLKKNNIDEQFEEQIDFQITFEEENLKKIKKIRCKIIKSDKN